MRQLLGTLLKIERFLEIERFLCNLGNLMFNHRILLKVAHIALSGLIQRGNDILMLQENAHFSRMPRGPLDASFEEKYNILSNGT